MQKCTVGSPTLSKSFSQAKPPWIPLSMLLIMVVLVVMWKNLGILRNFLKTSAIYWKGFATTWKTNTLSKLSIAESKNWKAGSKTFFLFFLIFSITFARPLLATNPEPKKELSPEQITKKKEVLSKVLKFGTSQERKQALSELLRFPKEDAGDLYKQVFDLLKVEKDMGMKINFLRLIAELNLTLDNEGVLQHFDDPNEDVAKQAILTAKKLKIAEAVPPLLEKLKKEDFTKNSNAMSLYISSLGELPDGKQGSAFLLSKYKEKFNNPDTRAQIALYLGAVGETEAESALSEIAFDESQPTTLRCYSINSLGKIKAEGAKPKLRELADSLKRTAGKLEAKKSQSLKMYTVGALVLLGEKEIIQELYEFARDDDAMVRLRAVEHLGNLKDASGIELLEYKRDRDPSPKVQKAARVALDKIKGIEPSKEAEALEEPPIEEKSNL